MVLTPYFHFTINILVHDRRDTANCATSVLQEWIIIVAGSIVVLDNVTTGKKLKKKIELKMLEQTTHIDYGFNINLECL